MKEITEMESESSSPTNFWITLSPDGRIDSVDIADGDEPGQMQSLFKATPKPILSYRESSATHLLVSVAPDGRFKTFRSSNTPLENWDLNWHRSQHEKLLKAYMTDPDSRDISDVEIAPTDPEAEKKRLTVEKIGEILPVRPVVGKNCNSASPNGCLQTDFTDWFGNAKKIPLAPTDANYKEKSAALMAAGFSFSEEEGELWVRP